MSSLVLSVVFLTIRFCIHYSAQYNRSGTSSADNEYAGLLVDVPDVNPFFHNIIPNLLFKHLSDHIIGFIYFTWFSDPLFTFHANFYKQE